VWHAWGRGQRSFHVSTNSIRGIGSSPPPPGKPSTSEGSKASRDSMGPSKSYANPTVLAFKLRIQFLMVLFFRFFLLQ
jgi:hypothetical protein